MKNLIFQKCFYLTAFIFICTQAVAQTDSLKNNRNFVSVNLAAALFSGEVGFYYDYETSDEVALQVSYGHRFYNFNLIIEADGEDNVGIRYFPQTGDILRFGIKKYLGDRIHSSPYMVYRLSYWYLHTPKYSKGKLDLIGHEIISVDKNAVNNSFGIGRDFEFENHLFLDLFVTGGLSIGEKKIHKYAYYNESTGHETLYPPNTFVKRLSVYFTIEFGCKVGFGW